VCDDVGHVTRQGTCTAVARGAQTDEACASGSMCNTHRGGNDLAYDEVSDVLLPTDEN
jgi:hypothetical protein